MSTSFDIKTMQTEFDALNHEHTERAVGAAGSEFASADPINDHLSWGAINPQPLPPEPGPFSDHLSWGAINPQPLPPGPPDGLSDQTHTSLFEVTSAHDATTAQIDSALNDTLNHLGSFSDGHTNPDIVGGAEVNSSDIVGNLGPAFGNTLPDGAYEVSQGPADGSQGPHDPNHGGEVHVALLGGTGGFWEQASQLAGPLVYHGGGDLPPADDLGGRPDPNWHGPLGNLFSDGGGQNEILAVHTGAIQFTGPDFAQPPAQPATPPHHFEVPELHHDFATQLHL